MTRAGLVLSSGADDALLLRTPLDVANLAVWLGCSREMARAAVREAAPWCSLPHCVD